jgi:hypothetical protein
MVHQRGLTFKSHAQPLGNANRRLILGVDHADHMGLVQPGKGHVERRLR